MQLMFLDESGDHNLEDSKIDPTFPLFVLTGVVVKEEIYKSLQKSLIELKEKIFNKKEIILHALEINRPGKSRQKELQQLTNKENRKVFYYELNKLLKKHQLKILSFAIDKPKFAKSFAEYPPDPYFLSFSYLLSKFAEGLRDKEHGRIYAEHRNKILDRQFLLSWKAAKLTRVGLVTNQKLREHNIKEPIILKKSWKNSGLEITDLISYRVSRWFMGKPEKFIGNEIALGIIKKNIEAAGLPDLPKVLMRS